MDRQEEKSLAETLDNAKMFPFSKNDLLRLVSRYRLELDLTDDRIIIYHDNQQYFFVKKEKDELYYLRDD